MSTPEKKEPENVAPDAPVVVIAGMRLRFWDEPPLVRVTDADRDGAWVGNAYGFSLAHGPFFNPNVQEYKEVLGAHAADLTTGAAARREICKHAKEVRDGSTEES